MREIPGLGGASLRVAAWTVGVFALALLGLPYLAGGLGAIPDGSALVVLPAVGITGVAFAFMRPKVLVSQGADQDEISRARTADLTRRLALALGVMGVLMTLVFGALGALMLYAIATWDTSK